MPGLASPECVRQASTVNERVGRLLPGIGELAQYRTPLLRGDVIAGVTVAAYVVPQVMAYASVAGLPPVVGLWAILAPLATYALLGSSRTLSVGPESATAILTATTIAPLAAGQPGRYATLAATLAVVAGLLGVLAYLGRLGFLADLLSKPILIGYLAGLALTMVAGQLTRVTGVPTSGGTFLTEIRSFVSNLGSVHWATLAFAAVIIAFLFLVQWRLPKVPGPLVAVVVAATIVAVFGLSRHGINVVGPVPTGLPTPVLPSWSDMQDLVLPAIGLIMLAYTDTILTARSLAERTDATVDPNQEFLALGTANIGAGLLQGFPVSSSASRTVLGLTAGARTQVSSLVTLGCVVLVLLFAGPLLASFPTAALGALVVYAAARLVDVREFRRLVGFRRSEAALAVGCLLGVLVVGILYGVVIAIGLSVALLMWRVARPHDGVLGFVPGLAGMHNIDDYPQATLVTGLVVYRYDSPIFFANAENFRTRALAVVDAQALPVAWFVLNAEANVEVDITGLDAVDALRRELEGRGIVFALARVKRELLDALDAYGLAASVGADRIFPTLPTAVTAYREWQTARSGE
jgi:sulfate permease, SulP family